MKEILTDSAEKTMEFASFLARGLKPGDIVALVGELGTGKTVFVKGLAKGLGVREHEYVNSPTFVIVKEYRGRVDLYHFDVYRLDEKSFCDTMDYERYFYGQGVTVIEWADKVASELPEKYLEVKIEHAGGDKRKIRITHVSG